MYDLSVIIPARNEEFLNRTVNEVLTKKRSNTQCIVILDGQWSQEPLEQHPDLVVIYHAKSVGQRVAINEGACISNAKYIMKLDAHCMLDEGYDTKLIQGARELGREVTQVPLQYNLHAFDWVCPNGHRRYQSPSGACEQCGEPTTKEIVWQRRKSRKTFIWRFDSDLHFQYWQEREKKEQGKKYVETMSLLGACFFMEREWYWELGGSDEQHGSWGQQGTEIACKSWLSGGKVITNRHTWFAHLFRTQGGDFSFPYPQSGKAVDVARNYSKSLWRNNAYFAQKRPLSWLIERFMPIPGWTQEDLDVLKEKDSQVLPKKQIVYYTDNTLQWRIAKMCRSQLQKSELPIISVSLKKADIGTNIVLNGEPSKEQMFRQIIAGLEASKAEYVFLAEHDVLYHPSHFDFTPEKDDTFYFNTNVWKWDINTDKTYWIDDLQQLSGMSGNRLLLLDYFKKQLESFDGHFEPINAKKENYMSTEPIVDIRHKNNMTKTKTSPNQFKNSKYAKGWKEGNISELWISKS